MAFYRLSEARVKRVLHFPKRTEEGVAPKTWAVMQPPFVKTTAGKPAWSQEIWVMYQDIGSKRKIISAWRYPGVSKPRSETTKNFLEQEYANYVISEDRKKEERKKFRTKMTKSKWFRKP